MMHEDTYFDALDFGGFNLIIGLQDIQDMDLKYARNG